MGLFDDIFIYTEKNLDKDFKRKHRQILKFGTRGFGYWIWKPNIIKQALRTMQEGEQLLYADAGCHLNSEGKKRLLEYFDIVEQSELKIGAFQLEDVHNEYCWSKKDLIVHLGVQDNDDILNSGQICATQVLLQKCEQSTAFVDEWLNIMENYHFSDDSRSISPEHPNFKGHRHDQSVFSLLCKLNNAVRFRGSEVYPQNNDSWDELKEFPIHDKRDRAFSTTGKIKDKLIRLKKKLSTYFNAELK